ncbi:MAG: hypothetical protein MHM6MM_004439 [Cercozoa sp. M6MM]
MYLKCLCDFHRDQFNGSGDWLSRMERALGDVQNLRGDLSRLLSLEQSGKRQAASSLKRQMKGRLDELSHVVDDLDTELAAAQRNPREHAVTAGELERRHQALTELKRDYRSIDADVARSGRRRRVPI